ncbi:hypothetical protein AVEN_126512-1 [Araneus ventricosus]|uniref:Galectin n=1 Tax=Araneus ventricosus TaxID=182803 RepID=A0A4Y2WXL5_ARAVE|nr:hypothetical protein AVEN_126512-1 [Araneus ventricosus]
MECPTAITVLLADNRFFGILPLMTCPTQIESVQWQENYICTCMFFLHRFTISLQKGEALYPPPDVAFRFDPRFFNRSIVRSVRYNGLLASEETSISHFPFQPGISFELFIRVEADKYSVSINGQHFIDFRHRLRPLEIFDTLYIENDVSISSIRFS